MATLSSNIKSVSANLGSVKGSTELAGEGIAQSKLPLGSSPITQTQSGLTEPVLGGGSLDQSYSSVPIQSISPFKPMTGKSRKLDYSKNYKSIRRNTRKQTDYILPSTTLPKRPTLAADTLDARSVSSDKTYLSVYATPGVDGEFIVSEVSSPISLQSANLAMDDSGHDGEVIITRLPNKG